ncbi:DUF3857 domain-containing protein [Sphingobacterium faecale]|uniref:DUF3857 domain-containing protein n=1 Tax=Sphingobacterium faecale TaxID=2803775 RepID=A0ABS1R8S4_9SPHI|nr:DUF3857 domain-containing protein [Sphingobacterium faecale]MBL1411121.1 DUF3857 domain-containing protein [Sphingobacterium faecale]
MLPYKIIFLLALISYTATAKTQQYPASDIPKSLLIRANAVIREEQTSFDIDYSTVSQTVYKVITVLNKAGDKYAELLLHYNKSETIKNIKGQVLDEFGKQINKFSQKDFKDYSASNQINLFDDTRVKHYAPHSHTYPYTIIYSYEVKHNQNLFIPYWQPNYFSDLSVANSEYKLTSRINQTLRIESKNIPHPPQITTSENSKTYKWTVKDIKARKEEPFNPLYQQDIIVVKAIPESFQYFKKRGTVNSWSDFGKWVYENLLAGKQDLSPETKSKVKELTAHLDSDKEKARILYTYMQNRTRYVSVQVGIGGLEPYPASHVEKLGYGDCKALVNYTQALLKEAGIESLYCIVEAGYQKKNVDIDFPNAVDGNHIILCLPFEKDTTWLECTSNRHPFGYLGKFTDDRLVLACTSNGGKLLRTISYPYSANVQKRTGDLEITETGNIQGSIITKFTGTQFDNHFENMFNGERQQHELLKKYYDIDNISFSNSTYNLEQRTEPAIIERTDITVKNYVVRNGDQIIFLPNLFNTAKTIPESKNRINPVYINRGYTDIDSITYTLKQKIKQHIPPIHKNINSPMGNYELQIIAQKNKLIYYRKLEIKEGTYPVEDYTQFHEFMRKVAEADRGKFTLLLATD